jgi:hypothetical protein
MVRTSPKAKITNCGFDEREFRLDLEAVALKPNEWIVGGRGKSLSVYCPAFSSQRAQFGGRFYNQIMVFIETAFFR